MSHRLPFGALLLLSSLVCACGGGDGDGDPVDARAIDAPAADAATDGPDVDAPGVDAATTDAATDASPDSSVVPDAMTTDAGIDAMPLPGEICQMPETISIPGGMGSATVSGTTLGYADNYRPPTTCTGYLEDGPDHVYTISIPSGSRLNATVTGSGGFDPAIYLVGSPAAMCDANPIVCLDGDDAGTATTVNAVRYDNTTNAAVTVFVVIDGTNETMGGAYMIAATVATIPPAPAGDTCTNSETVTIVGNMGTATGTTASASNYNNDYVPPASCAPGGGNDHVHTVTVPANTRVAVTVTPTSSFDPTLYLIAGPAASCSANPIVCLDGADAGGTDDPETVVYTNATASPVDVFVVVDGFDATDEGSYTLAVALGVPPGDTCSSAEVVTLTAGMATVAGTTTAAAGYVNDYEPPTTCTDGFGEDGNDHVHVVTVPMTQTLTAVATPTGGWDCGLYLIAGPAASCGANPIVCLDGADMGGTNGAETVTYTNSTGASVDVMIVVDSYLPSEQGAYSLAVTVQ